MMHIFFFFRLFPFKKDPQDSVYGRAGYDDVSFPFPFHLYVLAAVRQKPFSAAILFPTDSGGRENAASHGRAK